MRILQPERIKFYFMKKTYFLFCYLFLSSLLALGQVEFGIKAGGNLSNVTFKNIDEAPQPKTHLGFHAGALLKTPVTEKVTFRAELLYNQKGYSFDLPNYSRNAFSLHYISLPLLVEFATIDKLFLVAGSEISFLTNSRERAPNLNTLDIGLSGGVAYAFKENLGAEIRYTHGLRNINRFEHTDAAGNRTGETGTIGPNQNIQLGLYLMLNP